MPSTPTPQAGQPFADVQEKFDEKMHKMALAKRERDAQALAVQLGIDYTYLVGVVIAPGFLELIPLETARELQLVCFQAQGGAFFLAAVDPHRDEVLQYIKAFEDKNQSILAAIDTAVKGSTRWEVKPEFKINRSNSSH